jgi:hypothetical protein
MESAWQFVSFALIGLFLFGTPIWSRRRAIRRLAAAFGATATGSSFRVTDDGAPVEVTYLGHDDRWTQFAATLPPGEPLTLAIVRHRPLDSEAIDRGDMLDLVTDDDAFDHAYRVEAAPASVGLRVLDRDVRAFLLGRVDASLLTDQGAVRLVVRGRLKVDDVRQAIAVVRRALDNLRAAHAELAQATPPALVGGPHRGLPTDAPARAARDALAREVARLDRLLRRRPLGFRNIHLWFALLALVLSALGLWAR